MLQIKNVCKEYRTGGLVQKALEKLSPVSSARRCRKGLLSDKSVHL